MELFKAEVGPTAKPSAHDKWVESTAALTKAVAACTKAATQKPAPKKQQANKSTTNGGGGAKKQAKGASTSGNAKKRNSRSKTRGKKVAKVSPNNSTVAADITKKATEAKPAD